MSSSHRSKCWWKNSGAENSWAACTFGLQLSRWHHLWSFESRGAFFPGCLRLAVEFQYLVEKPPEWIFLRHLFQHGVAGSAKLACYNFATDHCNIGLMMSSALPVL